LFAVGFATALGLTAVVKLPSDVAVPVLMCLAFAVPAVLTTVLVFGSPYQRAFCMAALFPVGAMPFATLWLITVSLFDAPGSLHDLPDWVRFFERLDTPYRVYSGASWLLAFALGCTAVWIRWRLERSKRRPG